MIINHLKVALRHFKRHKLFTLINITGLSIGISASLIIFLIVNYDFSFDRFHRDQERIYRVVTNFDFSGEKVYNMGVSAPLPETIRKEISGVEVAPFITLHDIDVKVPSVGAAKIFKRQQRIILTDGSYFNIFSYEWLAGSANDALIRPNSIVLTVLVSVLAGFYPSLVLSAFKPVTILRNPVVAGSTRNIWLRKSLIMSQFFIAQFFIIATIVVSKQTRYALNSDLGFKRDAIVFINTPQKNNTESKREVFAGKLRQIPQINMISRGGEPPSSYQTNSTDAEFYNGKQNIKLLLYLKFADPDYINLYGIRLLAGRNIRLADSFTAFLINETYSRLMGFKNPADALGKYIEKFNGDKRMQVVGVVADFRQESLHNTVKPIAIMISNEAWNSSVFHIALKPQTKGLEDWKTAITAISRVWKEVYPNDEFNYNFYDESIARFYESEQRIFRLLSWSSGLSILISCLGLLGLAVYTIGVRTKEVGVRKVLGASVMQILALLSREMIGMVLLSSAIVTPVAWWAMHSWMQGFSDRTPISWWIFVLSSAGMLFTALLTLSSQTIRVALRNPVKSLRSE